MKVNGIIAEYNPFHKGHQYQLEESRRITGADYTVAAMSGNFVQRGAPALADKHLRTEMALRGGADLVLELPVLYATASSELFAAGAVALLDRLGVITHLCFGSECGDAAALGQIAAFLAEEPEAYRLDLKRLLKQGLSYPDARAKALSMQAAFPESPENSLLEQTGSAGHDGEALQGQPVSAEYSGKILPGQTGVVGHDGETLPGQTGSAEYAVGKNLSEQTGSAGHDGEALQGQPVSAEYSGKTPPGQTGSTGHTGQALPGRTILPENSREILSSPNNILGIDYIKEIIKRKSDMVPITIKRIGSGYHDPEIASAAAGFPPVSALAIRRTLQEGDNIREIRAHMPREAADLLVSYLARGRALYPDSLSGILYYKLLTQQGQGYEEYLDVSVELSNRIRNSLNRFTGFEAFCSLLKTKAYTHTRISRCLLHILLGIKKEDLACGRAVDYVPYARVLGFRRSAVPLLNRIKACSSIPLIAKAADAWKSLPPEAVRLWELDLLAGGIYRGVACEGTGRPAPHEFSTPLVIL